MKFKVTKVWKELPFKIATIIIPSMPSVLINSSETQPSGEDGIRYSGIEKSFYSEKKLWIKLLNSSTIDSIYVEIQNFI